MIYNRRYNAQRTRNLELYESCMPKYGHATKMVEQNILEPSTSPWGAPCLLAKKKTEHGLQVAPRLVDKLIKIDQIDQS